MLCYLLVTCQLWVTLCCLADWISSTALPLQILDEQAWISLKKKKKKKIVLGSRRRRKEKQVKTWLKRIDFNKRSGTIHPALDEQSSGCYAGVLLRGWHHPWSMAGSPGHSVHGTRLELDENKASKIARPGSVHGSASVALQRFWHLHFQILLSGAAEERFVPPA